MKIIGNINDAVIEGTGKRLNFSVNHKRLKVLRVQVDSCSQIPVTKNSSASDC
jgi:hypothetical protein